MVNIDLQRVGIVGAGGPEEGNGLLDAVPIQIHQLYRLGIGAEQRPGVFGAGAADLVDLLL